MHKFKATICIAVFSLIGISTSARADVPTTRPAAAARVLVFPFMVTSEPGHEWVGRAAQEGLASSIQKSGALQAAAGQSPSGATDDDSIRAAASAAHADFVILGAIQIVDGQMRIDARVVRGSDAESIANLKTEGSSKDLFAMEDRLAEQSKRKLAPAETSKGASGVAGPAATIQWMSPAQVYQSRYFDGDLARELAVPQRFAAETDKYNYRPTQFNLCGFGYYGSPGCAARGRGTDGGGMQQATPVSGW